MRAFVILALTVLPPIGCSQTPTGPTTTAASTPPNPAPVPETTIWHATATVSGVSATLNSCPVDHAVGQTRNIDWAIEDRPSPTVAIVIFMSPGGDYMGDPATPVYYGSRMDDQFVTVAEQDGQPTCFVWHGDLTGSFSADGRTFDAVENVMYVHRGEDDMVVRRHWTGTRQ
jgi:hypothetical protein